MIAILIIFLMIPAFGLFVNWHNKRWTRLNPPQPVRVSEKTLESWHDAYDDAIREGKDEVEAVRRADSVAQYWLPREARGLYPMYPNPIAIRALSDPVLYGRNAFGPRPGKVGGMGSHKNKDGIITFKWGGMTARMTSHEWVRQGRPTAQMVLRRSGRYGNERSIDDP